jgi:hypothetical protein
MGPRQEEANAHKTAAEGDRRMHKRAFPDATGGNCSREQSWPRLVSAALQ